MALWPGRRCFHTRGFVIAALKPGILAAGLVAGVWGTEGTRSPKRAASPPASSFIFVFGRGCEIFDWLAGWIACPPVAICIVTYYLLPLERDKWKLLVRVFFFSFQFCHWVHRWSNQNKNHPFGGANRGGCLPTPTYLTFCRFRIDFNSFIPKIFASPLVLDSVVFAQISFATQEWRVGTCSCCRVNDIRKIERSKA